MLAKAEMEKELNLPLGFTARAATVADAQIVTDMLNAEALHVLGKRRYSYEECLQEWNEPGFDIEDSSLMVIAPDGRLAGHIEIVDHDPIPARIFCFGRTHPDFYGLGIGTALLGWAARTAERALARVPADLRVVCDMGAIGSHQPSCELGEAFGSLTRAFWRMVIDLDQEIPEPDFPAELKVVTAVQFDHVRALYHAVDESFEDHWGHVKQPEAAGLALFKHDMTAPDFDPSLWHVVLDGDEVAAACLCAPKSNEDPTIGNVDTLAVRRPWRRRGLGMALLRHAFREFQQRDGYRQVALGVDANSLTGATRLYERVGMRVDFSTNVYERVLREGADPSTHQIERGEQNVS